jgi:hypothetical protein
MKYLYGYAVKHPDEQCAIRSDTPQRTLCGRDVAFLPAHDREYTPKNLHQVCRDLMFGARAPQAPPMPETGVCPVCGGEVWLDAEVVAPHGAWVVRGGMTVMSETPCDGAGMAPEVEQ